MHRSFHIRQNKSKFIVTYHHPLFYLLLSLLFITFIFVTNPKIPSPQEKVGCVVWFTETRSDLQMQRNFRETYSRTAPTRLSIRDITSS